MRRAHHHVARQTLLIVTVMECHNAHGGDMLDTLLTILFVTCGILAALVAACHFWEWYYNVPTSQDETGYFRSRDGWRLAVHRYRSREKGAGHPVILCHGLGGNRYSFDLRGAPSLRGF